MYENRKKEKIKACIAVAILILAIAITGIISMKYTVEGEKEYSSCSLSLSSKQDFIGPEKLLKVMNFFETWSASDTIEKKEANNIVWYTYSAKNLNERTDYYITEKDNKTFLVEYNVQKDSNSICEEFGKILIDSVLNKEA